MSLNLYMDEQVQGAITDGLRLRGLDVVTAQEDGMAGRQDPDLLDRAMVLGRVLFTRDKDFLQEATFRHRRGQIFPGIIFAQQLKVSIGQCVHDLELLAGILEPQEMTNLVLYLPLR